MLVSPDTQAHLLGNWVYMLKSFCAPGRKYIFYRKSSFVLKQQKHKEVIKLIVTPGT